MKALTSSYITAEKSCIHRIVGLNVACFAKQIMSFAAFLFCIKKLGNDVLH